MPVILCGFRVQIAPKVINWLLWREAKDGLDTSNSVDEVCLKTLSKPGQRCEYEVNSPSTSLRRTSLLLCQLQSDADAIRQ